MLPMRLFSTVLLTLLVTSCVAYKPPKHPTWKNTTSVEQMERLYWQAIKDKDWINVEAHTASTYTHVDAQGVSTKEQMLESYRNMNLVEFSLGEFQVTSSGDATILSYVAAATFEYQGRRLEPARFRQMSVWQQQKKGWTLIASSTAPIQ